MSEALRVWLAQELNRRQWSHRELARQTDFSQAYVSRILSGEQNPSVNFCHKIAAALDIAPESVLRLAGILPPIEPASTADSSILQELIELARNLPPQQQKQLLDYTRFLYQTNQTDSS